MKTIMKTAFAAVMLLALAVPAAAENYLAVAGNIKGTVQKSTGGGAWKNVSNHDKLAVGDKVKTGADSSVSLSFGEGNVLTLSALTSVTLTDMSRTGSVKSSVLTVENGRMFAAARKLKNSDSVFKVVTPHVISGVRGSEVFAEVSSSGTKLQVVEGVFNVEVKGKSALLNAGYQMDVGASLTEPPSPAQIDPGTLDALKREAKESSDAGKAVENLSAAEDNALLQLNEVFENLERAKEGSCHSSYYCYYSSCYTYTSCGGYY